MKHLSSAVLLQKLKSSHSMERAFAAEELGVRRDRAAVAPILQLLEADPVSLDDLDAFGPAIEALAAIGDASATRTIVKILRARPGYPLHPDGASLSGLACRALVRLGARSAVPALKDLQLGKLGFTYRDRLARAIAELGGVAEAPFLEQLLADQHPLVRLAGVAALGQLRHLPAAVAIEPMCRSSDEELRWTAHFALVAMGVEGARDRLRSAATRLTSASDKELFLGLLAEHGLTCLADLAFELALDPRWATTDDLLFATLDAAVRLGCDEAAARLWKLHDELDQPRCRRIRAAAILTEHARANLLSSCLEFLRSGADPEARDPRDPPMRRNATQREVIAALRRYGQHHRGQRPIIAECLYEVMWRGLDEEDRLDEHASYIPDHASHAVYALTGALTRLELDQWRALQVASS